MAERRMFAKTIVTSDAFLDMPPTARCLYFTLGMFADDDGFVNNPKSIMRQVGSTTDDINILISKKFLLAFDSGVIVIKHWRIHNYIRGDRKHDTKYVEELSSMSIDENGAYTLSDGADLPQLTADSAALRRQAYADSELPYSFDYKIRQAFWNQPCPICGRIMSSEYLCQPTIQHNMPISKGGRHELGNISVICQSCNSSIRDNPTDSLNAEEVIEAWEALCRAGDRQMSVNRQAGDIPRLGKVSIGKDSIDKESKGKRFTPPTVEEVREYVTSNNYNVNADNFVDFYESKGWLVGKNKMKDWKAAVRTWARRDNGNNTGTSNTERSRVCGTDAGSGTRASENRQGVRRNFIPMAEMPSEEE